MRIAINALPINNFSGRNVLLGHLRNLALAGQGKHTFYVLHHAGNRDLRRDFGSHVQWIECAGVGAHWAKRLVWETLHMRGVLRRLNAELLLSTSGAVVPNVAIPQWVLAQNPWCFFPQFHRNAGDRLKAKLQRIGYARAQCKAEAMFYLSDYMVRAYLKNAGQAPRHGDVVYVGVDDALFADAAANQPTALRGLDVLTVSVMARHKAVEDVIHALESLHAQGIPARLALVGPWPDTDYRQAIESQINAAGLASFVTITGGVNDATLRAYYRQARVFCLLSRCESFGIPAVEAQVFGTPCVVADDCAPPEIAGPGGKIVPVGDSAAASAALATLLNDDAEWASASASALLNVERFRWARVTDPMIRFLDTRVSGTA